MLLLVSRISFSHTHMQTKHRLRAIVRNARKAVRITIRDHSDLEDWVDDEGRVVLIGEAAHPFPVRLHNPLVHLPRMLTHKS